MRCESVDIDPEKADRACGFLTSSEREYLLRELRSEDSEEQMSSREATTRHNIRVRTRHALADFALLQAHASQELKDSVVQLDSEPPIFHRGALEQIHHGLLAFASDVVGGEELTELIGLAARQPGVAETTLQVLRAREENDREKAVEALRGPVLQFLNSNGTTNPFDEG